MAATMAKSERLHLRANPADYAAWERASNRELRKLNDWAERVLNLVADSEVTVMELNDLLNKATEGKKKG